MPMNWDGEAHQKLLLCILAVHDIKVDFAAVAATLGPDCTPRAVQEQLKKLKRQSLVQMGGASTSTSKAKAKKTGDVDSPATKKRKITAPKSNVKKAKTSSQSVAGGLIKNVKDEDEEEEEAAPKPFKSIFGNGANQGPDEGDEDDEAMNAQLAGEMGGEDGVGESL